MNEAQFFISLLLLEVLVADLTPAEAQEQLDACERMWARMELRREVRR